ncbi:major capsid protein [Rathayibacter phage NCPPB3778]|nr:major capsid protein [Rathayibacter phage NCPPB3778]
MTSLTYPVPAISGTDSLTTEQIHQILSSSSLFARRVRDIADQRFISDALLTGRFEAVGGAFLYENGSPIELSEDLEVVAPGGEYSRAQAQIGGLSSAIVSKIGKDIPVTDEAIKRRGINVVDLAIGQLVNRAVRQIDSAALGVIASKVTQTQASGAWTTAKAIALSVELAKAAAEESGEGHVLDTIVLKPSSYAQVMSVFLESGLLPREAANPLTTGSWPSILDVTWLRSAHVPTSSPLILDTAELGGMADERNVSPGYGSSDRGIETKTMREDTTDSWLLRARRITVPVVTDPTAGYVITGTGL